MKVKHEDRDIQIEYFRMALNMCEIGVDYTTADLIVRVHKLFREKGDKFSLEDAVRVLNDWQLEWINYQKTTEEK